MATWYTVEDAKADWLGAPDDDTIKLLLDVSQAEVTAYAPALDPDATEPSDPDDEDSDPVQSIPDGYRWAHLAHARNIWNAQNVSPSGGVGADGESFAFTPFPLDWAIKARLRPHVIFGGSVG